MDIIADISFGHTWGCLREDDDVEGWFESFEMNLPFAFRASAIPWIQSFFNIPFIAKLIFRSDKDEFGPGKMLGIVKQILDKRFAEEDPGYAGGIHSPWTGKTQLVTEVSLQMYVSISFLSKDSARYEHSAAGGDTTATTFQSTMLHIITNLHAYRALQAEIDFSAVSGSIISDEQAKTLPYLQAVIKEGAHVPSRNRCDVESCTARRRHCQWCFIPCGTEIGECFWGVQRNKKVYGEDAVLFRPERWLEAEGEKLEKMKKTIQLAWDMGNINAWERISCLWN